MSKIFGERLRELRKEKNLSIVELAKDLNVGKSIISYWERGENEPSLSSLIAISQFFGVSIEYLAGLED